MPTAYLKAAVLSLILLPGLVLAQTSIPDEMVRKNEINEGDRQAIRAFVDANKSGLSGAAAEIKRARQTLLGPLEKPGVTVQFRSAYATALLESASIEKLAANKESDLIATNALRLAGQAATGNTVKIVIESLKDTRPQVRYAATVAARSAFLAARANPALSQDQGSALLRALADLVASDDAKDPVDGAIQAISAARAVNGLRSLAVERLTDSAGKRALLIAASDKAQDLTPLLRALSAVQEEMIDAATLTPAARTGAATLAGQSLIAVSGQWKGDEPGETAANLVKVTDAVLSLVDTASGGNRNVRLAPTVTGGKREAFERELKGIIGPGGMLQSEPYSVPAQKLKL